jgi:hypothetical protein
MPAALALRCVRSYPTRGEDGFTPGGFFLAGVSIQKEPPDQNPAIVEHARDGAIRFVPWQDPAIAPHGLSCTKGAALPPWGLTVRRGQCKK